MCILVVSQLFEHTMSNINNVADYVISKCISGGDTLSALKLQKLLYYVQAWHLALYNKPLFDEKFQAWVHGPVSRTIFDRFSKEKTMYSLIREKDITPGFNPDKVLSKKSQLHIDSVLEVYGRFSGSQLEAMTHDEEPWIQARGGINPISKSEAPLDNKVMAEYYKKRLK